MFILEGTKNSPPYHIIQYLRYNINIHNIEDETIKLIKNLDGVEFLSQVKMYKQKIVKDFKNYPLPTKINDYNPIVKGFKKFNGHKEYVSQSFIDENKNLGNDILGYLLNILKKHNKKFISIVGGYGSGKTSLCHYILYEMSKTENNDLIPIFIPLGYLKKFDENMTFEDLSKEIYNFIIIEYKFILHYDDFYNFVNNGKFLFIFDALDELAQKINTEIITSHFERIRYFEEKGNTVILTSRQTYFLEQHEKQLREKTNSIVILDFDQEQIQSFIVKKSRNKDGSFSSIINNIIQDERFSAIIKKPLFLNIICERHKDFSKYSTVNDAVMMKILTDEWLTTI